jgi:hypothetical protein
MFPWIMFYVLVELTNNLNLDANFVKKLKKKIMLKEGRQLIEKHIICVLR